MKKIRNVIYAHGFLEAFFIITRMIFWKLINQCKFVLTGVRLGKGVIFEGPVYFSGGKRIFVGDNVKLGAGIILSAGRQGVIEIGSHSYVGTHTIIIANVKVKIGDNCLIAPFNYVIDTDHGIKLGKPINTQDYKSAPVIIGDDVWIGAHCSILKGVNIGNGAVVGAGAVVNRSIPDDMIAVGVPAKVIKAREK